MNRNEFLEEWQPVWRGDDALRMPKDLDALIASERAAERERCANVADQMAQEESNAFDNTGGVGGSITLMHTASRLAYKIRALGPEAKP